MTYKLKDLDRKIIQATQGGLPMTTTPFVDLANQIGEPFDQVLKQLKTLHEHGVIRRIAAIPQHYNIGYKFNGMTVWNVNDDEITSLGKLVGQLDFVSHCYKRPRVLGRWNYNLFAMVHGKTKDECLVKYDKIKQILLPHLGEHDILFSRRVLKKTGFRM